jgi:hypothetical protein
MGAFRHLTATHRRLLLALFAFALFVRAFVPEGWMPMTSADGGIGLMICSGMAPDTPMAMAMDGHGDVHKQRPARDQSGDHPCAFAGIGLAHATAPELLAPEPLRTDFVEHRLPETLAAIGHGLAAPPPPQTGPPLTA